MKQVRSATSFAPPVPSCTPPRQWMRFENIFCAKTVFGHDGNFRYTPSVPRPNKRTSPTARNLASRDRRDDRKNRGGKVPKPAAPSNYRTTALATHAQAAIGKSLVCTTTCHSLARLRDRRSFAATDKYLHDRASLVAVESAPITAPATIPLDHRGSSANRNGIARIPSLRKAPQVWSSARQPGSPGLFRGTI